MSLGVLQLNASAIVHQKIASIDLLGAELLGNQVREIETNYDTSNIEGEWFQKLAPLVRGCVILCVTHLEININETLMGTGKPNIEIPDFENRWKGDLEYKPIEKMPILDKYQIAIKYKNPNYKNFKSDNRFSSANDLISLRNAFIHSKLRMEDGPYKKLKSRIESSFELCKSFNDKSDFFLRRCMSFDCCRWAIEVTKNFNKYFHEAANK